MKYFKNQAEAEMFKIIPTSPASVAHCPTPPAPIPNDIHKQTHFGPPQAHCTVASKKIPEFPFLAKGSLV